MERSISSRFYFDYNATSPLSLKVIDFFRSGEFLFGNPSSLHQTGKKSKKFISETSEFLYKTFGLTSSDYQLLYHSGASEGINTFFKGIAFRLFKQKEQATFFFSTVDHACVVELKEALELLGHKVQFFGVDRNGQFDIAHLIDQIKQEEEENRLCYLNLTYINNESGVVWPLTLSEQIKAETKAVIHVDAVQLVGKIENWKTLSPLIDAYTFSGHKFGAMKGVGFTFLKKTFLFTPLIVGGSQQSGLRAGTENAFGIYSLKLALQEIIEKFDAAELSAAKNLIEEVVMKVVGDKGEIVARNAPMRNLNTIFLILYGQKAELLSARFDLLGIDLSTGSACSSGIIKENRILMSMMYSFDDSRSSLRFSFSPLMNQAQAALYAQKIISILEKMIH